MTAKLAKIVLSIIAGMFGLVLVMGILAGAGPVAALRDIEQKGGSTLVAGAPSDVLVDASPEEIRADGDSNSTITGTVRDSGCVPLPGAFIAFTTSLGTIDQLCYTEAEDASVNKSPGGCWSTEGPYSGASGGYYVKACGTVCFNATVSWTFSATAISMLYVKDPEGGVAEIKVDGSRAITVDMYALTKMAAERVITAGLSSEPHIVTVKYLDRSPVGLGTCIRVDAFRCGATTDLDGNGTATLTSTILSCGSADAIVTALTGGPSIPYMITGTQLVKFTASVPNSVTVTADPDQIAADGVSTSDLEAAVEDQFGEYVPNCTMVSFVTDENGSDPGVWAILPYELVEGEDAEVTKSSSWSTGTNSLYHGGEVISSTTAGAIASWNFTGTAVSLMYAKLSDAGVATVTVDSGLPIAIDMYASPPEFQVEHVITHGLSYGRHVITVTVGGYTVTGGTDTRVYVDAFRSGTSTSDGIGMAMLTAGTKAGVVMVEATGVGRQCCETDRVVTDTVPITLTAGNPYTLTITPTDVPITCCVTSTLQFTVTDQYSNVVGAVVPRTLTVDFTSTPYGDFAPPSVEITDGVGSVEFHGYEAGIGAITGTVSGYGVVGTAALTVAEGPCYTLDVNADRTWIYVTDTNTYLLADFPYTTTITAELRDSCNNPVQNGTVVTFTTSLGYLGSDTITKTTINGLATAVLTSEQLAVGVPTRTAYITVTGTGCPVSDTISVDFVRHVYTLTVTADPDEMRVGGYTSILTADVDDGFGNPTPDGVTVVFTITPAAMASVPSTPVETQGGEATATATSGMQAGVATVEAAATGSTITNTTLITITAGDPYTLTITPADVSTECCMTSTLQFTVTDQYSNVVGAVVPRALTVDFTSTPYGDFTPPSVEITDGVGSVEFHGYEAGTGAITGTVSGYGVVGTATLTVAPAACNTLDINPHRPWLYVTDTNTSLLADFVYTTSITAELRDSCNNPVADGTVVTFTTSLGNVGPVNPTTVNGLATAVLTSGNLPAGVPTQTAYITVTGAGCPVSDTTSVDFGRHVYTLTVSANPDEMRIGGNTSDLTANVYDGFGDPTPDGVMVGFTITPSIRASVPHEFVEGEDATEVTRLGTWSEEFDPSYHGGRVISSTTAGATASWYFTGTAVSLMYAKLSDAGVATVTVDSDVPIAVDMYASSAQYQVEKVIANTLSPGQHVVTVTVAGYNNPASLGTTVNVDAFRSGTTTSGGTATAIATSGSEAGVATIEAAAIGSTITNTTLITITAGDPYTLTITPTDVSITCCVTSTVQFTVTDQYSNVLGAVSPRSVKVCLYCNPGSLVDTWSPDSCVVITNGVGSAEFHAYQAGTGTMVGYVQGFPSAQDTLNITVTASSPATLNVTRAPDSILADGFDTATITATVKDSCDNPVCNRIVTFTADSGSFEPPPNTTLTITKTTNCSGVATATLRSVCISRRANITVTVDSLTETTYVDMVGVAWDIQLAANPTSIQVGGHTSDLTATVNDQFGYPVLDGTVVTFTTNLGSVGSDTTTKTTTDGVAEAILTSSETAGTATITAAAGSGVDMTTDTVTVTFEAGPPYTVTLEANPMTLTVGNTSTLTATVTDQYNNTVADGTVVTFTTSLGDVGSQVVTKTTTSGLATAELTSQEAGTAVVTATADSKYGTTNVTFQPNLPYTLTLAANPTVLTVGETSTLTATVKDQYDNNVADGTSVLFETSLGSLGSLTVTKTTVDGIALAALTSQVPGTATVVATADLVSDTVDVAFEVGPPYTVTLEANPISVMVGGFTSTLTVTVTDQFNNDVADGTSVLFETSLGSLGSVTVTKLTANGVAMATLTSGNVAGLAMITATAGSKVATTVVTFTPDVPDVITLVADPTSLTVGESSTLTATVKDQYDNNVADGTSVLFETSLGSLGSLTVTKTTVDGIAVAALTSQLPGVATITVTVDSKVATTTVEFQPGPPDTVILVANPASLTVGETSMLTATVKDQYDNNVADGTVVNFETSFGSVGSTAVAKTTVNGVATATLTSQVSGTAVVTATSDSKYDTANVTFNPGPPDTMTVEADPTSIPIGGFTSDIAATLRDQYDNLVSDGTEVTFVTNLGSIGSNSVVKTTVNGVATATLTSELIIGTANITATSGSAVGHTQVIFTIGPPETITAESWPPTIEVGGNTATITATVRDIGGYVVADGTPVVFTTDFASLGSTTVTKYTINGLAVATLTSGLTPGVAHITATADAKFDTVIVKVAAGPPFAIDATADPTYIPIGGATSYITATVKDRYDNNVTNGTNVDFVTTLGSVLPSSGATEEGAAVTTLTSELTKGTARVTAISGPAQGWVDVVFTVGPPFYINVVADPTSIGLNGQTSDIRATVKDIGGNNVADGTEVTFVTTLGTLGSDTVIKTTTSGVAAAVLTSETTAGTAVITATADSKYHTTQVVFNPDPPYAVTVTADPMAIPANGVSTSAVRAKVTDQYGNVVADGITCYFNTTLGTVWPSFDNTLHGVAETTLTSSEDLGLATVTATCEGKQGTVHVSFYQYSFKLYLPVILKRH